MSKRGGKSSGDIEEGTHHSHQTQSDEDSLCFSDAEAHSWQSPYGSNGGGSTYDEGRAASESGVTIVLGCSCKGDLAAAHKQCAETWFKIKGNKICEICGSTALNVVGVSDTEPIEQWSEANTSTAPPAVPPSETRSFWQGHRLLKFLVACLCMSNMNSQERY
ncbi:hypothetical protein C4D60_Mb07t14480 [Musa balbisiana]|uniref:RING-CH-type domain-containing protein n=1 Tax=Musa balbisiana TaxID=52838 RepID=A0A4S8JFI2_MUSBA|nr:hypothetical protein C4D60_Mb07t14480 [Musa balbisiana]